MERTIFLYFMFQPSLSALLTVEAERDTYRSNLRGEVEMSCSFRPKPSDPGRQLKVAWHWIQPGSDREVYVMDDGVEHAASAEYQGRVTLLNQELREGWLKLKLSDLQLNDSGTYRCLVQTANGEDYKTVTLDVVDGFPAPGVNNKILYIILGTGILVLVIMAAVFIVRRRKGRNPPSPSGERRTKLATHVLWRK